MSTTVTIFDDGEKTPSMELVQQLVGGYFELIQIDYDTQMLVNEDGIMLKLPVNKIATVVAKLHILGNVVILIGSTQWKGGDAE